MIGKTFTKHDFVAHTIAGAYMRSVLGGGRRRQHNPLMTKTLHMFKDYVFPSHVYSSLFYKAFLKGQNIWKPLSERWLEEKQNRKLDLRIWRATGQTMDVLSGRIKSGHKAVNRYSDDGASLIVEFPIVDDIATGKGSKWRLLSSKTRNDEGFMVNEKINVPARPWAGVLIAVVKDDAMTMQKKFRAICKSR